MPSFQVQLRGGWASPGVAPGYDIILTTQDSNGFFGASFDGALDVASGSVDQLGVNSPNVDTVIASANDPLDQPDTSGAPTHIGHSVHFAKDYYIANGLLLGSRKVLIVPYDMGGSYAGGGGTVEWGAMGGTPGTPTVSAGNLLDHQTSRRATALALPNTNTVVMVMDLEGSNAYTPYGNAFQAGVVDKYRWSYHRKLQYLRNLVGATVPIVICRSSKYAIDAGGANFSTNGLVVDRIIKSMARRFPYLGVADSQSPSALGDSGAVHFNAADQRSLAGRYYTAYLAAQANTTRTVVWEYDDVTLSSLGWLAGFTLANGNLDVSGDANSDWKTAVATWPLRTGKAYCEVKIQAMASGTNLGYLGFCNADRELSTGAAPGVSSALDGPAPAHAGQWGGLGDNSVLGYTKDWTGNASWTTNDIVMLAVDMAAGKAWIGKNGTWYNSGDPAAGTGQWISGIVDPIYIAASIYTGTGNTYRLAPRSADFTYTAPSGFSAWGV